MWILESDRPGFTVRLFLLGKKLLSILNKSQDPPELALEGDSACAVESLEHTARTFVPKDSLFPGESLTDLRECCFFFNFLSQR